MALYASAAVRFPCRGLLGSRIARGIVGPSASSRLRVLLIWMRARTSVGMRRLLLAVQTAVGQSIRLHMGQGPCQVPVRDTL
jgi:hypothetical protein